MGVRSPIHPRTEFMQVLNYQSREGMGEAPVLTVTFGSPRSVESGFLRLS